MTNAMIILVNQCKLLEQGVLKYTGRTIKGVNAITGEPAEVPEIQPIHTYSHWKSLGYQVKRGQHAVAKFAIWKYTKRKTEEGIDEEEAQRRGYCFMKMSSWFTEEQVEKIKA